jgi:hypothetical protein
VVGQLADYFERVFIKPELISQTLESSFSSISEDIHLSLDIPEEGVEISRILSGEIEVNSNETIDS